MVDVEVVCEQRAVNLMADDSPTTSAESSDSELPAPLGRTLSFIALGLLSSVALCWGLRGQDVGPDTGTIAGRPTPLVSEWKGRIERILVKPGDSVEAGETIAILVNEHLLLSIDRQNREVEQIQAALKQAERSAEQELTHDLKAIDEEIVTLKTQAGLLGDGEIKPEAALLTRIRELDALRIGAPQRIREKLGIDRIREELVRAEAKLRQLQSESTEIRLPAPVTGTVERVLRKPGERVVEGTPLLELANQDQPFLLVEMPEPLAKRFALGDKIPLNFPGREESIGQVADMVPLEPEPSRPPAEEHEAKKPISVRLKIVPADEDWPEIPLESPVRVRTSDSRAMMRRVN